MDLDLDVVQSGMHKHGLVKERRVLSFRVPFHCKGGGVSSSVIHTSHRRVKARTENDT